MSDGNGRRAQRARYTRGMGRGLAVAVMVIAGSAGVAYYYQHVAGRVVQAAENSNPSVPADARVDRGRYLVTITGCGDCHTPLTMTDKGPRPDPDRLLSGHPERATVLPAPKTQGAWVWSGAGTGTAFAGPWGVTFAANLTPDKNTGLGIWTEPMFVRAMRTGKHWGEGRDIQPPMPWRAYAKMTDEDLKAVFAYLRSVRPVRNYVPDYVPAGEE